MRHGPTRRRVLACASVSLALGRGARGADGATPDGGAPDGGTPDGGTPDGGTPDGATVEGATVEKATADAVSAVPLSSVRLESSPFLAALDSNRRYLGRLDDERLLHNYRLQAGLVPLAPRYGGWESETIGGHTLGHVLSALALLHAQTGEAAPAARIGRIVAVLALCQSRHPDGYVGGFTRVRNGVTEGGRVVFEEVRRGEIDAAPFDLNGAWSPLYNWHKLLAGLLDADLHARDPHALGVAVRLADYIDGVFAALDDAGTQRVLRCEYGGLNESFAELHARTGELRYLRLAERLHDRATLDPLARGTDDLGGLHANTQIPKIIGVARLHALTGTPSLAVAADTFWRAATAHHAYAIGGVGDREYFTAPDTMADYVTDQTCESCASYNMLKLTRLLYARHGRAAFFDYHERTILNHVLAQHDPSNGMFTYMMPVMSGAGREWSTPFGDFWCCVGTGLESHAKHGDSIYWHSGRDALLVNLFIPSTLDWDGIRLALATRFPAEGEVAVRVVASDRTDPWTLRLRVPGWSAVEALRLDGDEQDGASADADGYVSLRRRWRGGEVVTLRLRMPVRAERPAGGGAAVAFLHGPTVLAADLGPSGAPFDGAEGPVLLGDPADPPMPVPAAAGRFRLASACGREWTLGPFSDGRHRRNAIYVPVLTETAWRDGVARDAAARQARASLLRAAADVVVLGDDRSERRHALRAAQSYALAYRLRRGRDARAGGFVAFRMRTKPGPLALRLTTWGEDRDRLFRITVDGTLVATVSQDGTGGRRFVDADFPVPEALTAGRHDILVRIEPVGRHAAGPLFGACLLPAGLVPV